MHVTGAAAGRASLGLAAALVAVVMAATTAPPAAAAPTGADGFDAAVGRVLDLPYDPGYAPTGTDAAFAEDDYPAAFPVTDTSTGTCCSGPVPDQPPLADLAPPFADFPDAFELVELESFDGTPLHAYAAIEPGAPGVVVMHGFNTNGKWSVVRYAAFLHANGYSVIAPDHRDMGREWERGGSWWPEGDRHGQSLGWKEAEDLLVAAAELDRRGVDDIGVLGFSEGAQNTMLALGRDLDGLIDTALTFSGPADQLTQVTREAAATSALLTTVANNPDVCGYLAAVGAREEFSATPNFMLRHDSAVDTLDGVLGAGVDVPALHLYAADDELVPDYHATILASRTLSMPNQHTVLVEAGNHAYFYDRWWTQAAALSWFGDWLDPDGTATTAEPTVAQPASGTPLREQTIELDGTTRADGDAERRTDPACPASEEPVGPTPMLLADGQDARWTLDGRRSYSGWDDHEVASWELDPGDGTPPATGSDVLRAVLAHTYAGPGTYDAALTITDDTGRRATATRTIEVAGTGGQADPVTEDGTARDRTVARDDGGSAADLATTGGGMAGLGFVALVAVVLLVPRRSRHER